MNEFLLYTMYVVGCVSMTALHCHCVCVGSDLVREFGVETILIYNALLLKKKVVVYASSVESLLTICR